MLPLQLLGQYGQLEEVPSLGRGFRAESRFRLLRVADSGVGGWRPAWLGHDWFELFLVQRFYSLRIEFVS